MEEKKQTHIDPQKRGQWRLWNYEQKWIGFVVPRLPRCLNGRNLTLLTALWATGAILFGLLTQENMQWLWGISAMIVVQYFTDSVDGAVARYRNEQLPKWGHYMDHFLDYVFLGGLAFGYTFALPEYQQLLTVILALFGALYISVYLMSGITGKFMMGVARFGMNEVKIFLLVFNVFIIYVSGLYIRYVLWGFIVVLFVALIMDVFRAQKLARQLDEEVQRNVRE